MKSMHDELKSIADRTLNQAFLGAANESNPMFVELMQRHEKLGKLCSEITERMIAMMKSEKPS